MTKQAFIQELTAALAPIDAQVRAEIIADINEHFTEGAACGQTEEEICRNLGQPGQIAEQVLEEYKAFKSQESTAYFDNDQYDRHDKHDHHNDFGDAISSALESAGIDEIVSSALQAAANATRAATNIAGNALANWENNKDHIQREVAWGNDSTLWEGQNTVDNISKVRGGYEFNLDKTFADISAINIDLCLANVRLLPAPQSNDIRVTVTGRSRNSSLGLENKNGTLVIRQKAPTFTFSIFGFKPSLEVAVYVPSGFNGAINTNTGAGHINATGIGGNLYFDTGAGNVTVKGTITDDIKVNTGAGNVNIECQEAGRIRLDSGAGSINFFAGKINGDVKLSSGAGGISVESHDVNGNITASNGAGNIKMRLPQYVNCRIKAQKPGIGSLRNYITGNPDSPYTLKASTGVGSITLEAVQNQGVRDRQN